LVFREKLVYRLIGYMYVEPFLNYLKFEKRYSEHTIRAYIDDLNQFISFQQNTNPLIAIPNEIDHLYIRNWIVNLTNSQVSSRTISRKISSLKKYFRFLISNDYIIRNPFDKIISPKVKKKLPPFINSVEIDQLSEFIEFSDDFAGKRDRVILEILYCTGIRLSELINLRQSDIDSFNLTIKVLGKRNKERIIPFPSSLLTILKEYEQARIKMGLSAPYYITTIKGEKSYPKLIYRIVTTNLSKITTNEKKNPHILRHTYATHLLNNGAELNAVKELLGHANLSATQIYTHNTFSKLNRIYKLAHPRA
jgi:integrase/recombinase XerC